MLFVYPWVLVIGTGIILCIIMLGSLWWRPYSYYFPAYLIHNYGVNDGSSHLFFVLRILALCALFIALARPRSELQRQYSPRQGIDIMLVLDVSGSMDLYDDVHDKRSRLAVAKAQAISFMHKRTADALGVVLCGGCTVARCPLTYDKQLLQELLQELEVGTINADGTLLSAALMLAGKKLAQTSQRNKIIIVLTDGAPSPHDIQPADMITYLKKEGIKVYTIGIGGDEGGYLDHPLYGIVAVQTPLNKELLDSIAQQTGGQFFQAKKPEDLAHIYDIINDLETGQAAVPEFVHYREYFIYFLWIAWFLVLLELLYGWWMRWL